MYKPLILLSFFVLFFAQNSHANTRANLQNISVLADEDFVEPIIEIVKAYSLQNSILVSVSFAAGDSQLEKIELGTQADIFITKNSDYNQQLKDRGLVDFTSERQIARGYNNTYFAIVVAGENMDEARRFIGFLQSVKAKEIFDEYGYGF